LFTSTPKNRFQSGIKRPSNTPVPISIFHEDGTMRKTSKADLSHQLESEATSRTELKPFDRSHSVIIRDGMTLIQALNVKSLNTFDDLALHLIQMQKSCFPKATFSSLFRLRGILRLEQVRSERKESSL
jgi:hypothetical protein